MAGNRWRLQRSLSSPSLSYIYKYLFLILNISDSGVYWIKKQTRSLFIILVSIFRTFLPRPLSHPLLEYLKESPSLSFSVMWKVSIWHGGCLFIILARNFFSELTDLSGRIMSRKRAQMNYSSACSRKKERKTCASDKWKGYKTIIIIIMSIERQISLERKEENDGNRRLPRSNCHSCVWSLNDQVDVGSGMDSRVGLRRKLNRRRLPPPGWRRKDESVRCMISFAL